AVVVAAHHPGAVLLVRLTGHPERGTELRCTLVPRSGVQTPDVLLSRPGREVTGGEHCRRQGRPRRTFGVAGRTGGRTVLPARAGAVRCALLTRVRLALGCAGAGGTLLLCALPPTGVGVAPARRPRAGAHSAASAAAEEAHGAPRRGPMPQRATAAGSQLVRSTSPLVGRAAPLGVSVVSEPCVDASPHSPMVR